MSVLAQLPPGASLVVIRLRSLGDAVLITPALALIKQTRPDLRLSVVLDRAFAAVLENAPAVDEVIAVERGDLTGAIGAIRARKPELCLNLHGGASSAWMTLASGARRRAGYAHFAKRFAYNVRIPRAQEVLGRATDAAVHTAEHHASAALFLGASAAEIPAARLAADGAPSQQPYAVLHVAAAYQTKRWSEHGFRSIASVLRESHGLEPILIAGPESDRLLNFFPEFERRPGLSIRDLKTLLSGAALFVGNDSGPAHIAAAFSVPSVVVFGSSSSAVWGPWKTRHEIVETSWDCKPCPGDRCYAFEQPRCILSVTPEAVEQAIGRLLQR